MYILYTKYRLSFPHVARITQRNDHTTVLSGIKRYCFLHGIDYASVARTEQFSKKGVKKVKA
jgi:hypothetical protein